MSPSSTTLESSEIVTLRVDDGSRAKSDDLVVGSDAPLLNNDGDTITVQDGGTVVLEYSYGGGGKPANSLAAKHISITFDMLLGYNNESGTQAVGGISCIKCGDSGGSHWFRWGVGRRYGRRPLGFGLG